MSRSKITTKSAGGQATLELLVSSTVLMVLITGAGWVIKAEWDRGRCAYLVFEKTHSELVNTDGGGVGSLQPLTALLTKPSDVEVTDTGDEVAGIGHCGGAQESLQLRKLEAVPW